MNWTSLTLARTIKLSLFVSECWKGLSRVPGLAQVLRRMDPGVSGMFGPQPVLRVGPREMGMKSSLHPFRSIYLSGAFVWEKGTACSWRGKD